MRTDPAEPCPASFDHEPGLERRDVETGRCQLRLCIGFGGWMPCGLPTFQLSSGQYSLRCPNHGGPKRNLSRPREATVAEEANLSHQTQPSPGGHPIDGQRQPSQVCYRRDHKAGLEGLGVAVTPHCLLCGIYHASNVTDTDESELLAWALENAQIGEDEAELVAQVASHWPWLFVEGYRAYCAAQARGEMG